MQRLKSTAAMGLAIMCLFWAPSLYGEPRVEEIRYKKFRIVFEFDDAFCSVPAIVGAGAVGHYDAQITVFRRKKFIARFRGEFTFGRCYEDDPQTLIKKAKKLKQNGKADQKGSK